VADGEMTMKQRDRLLAEMTDEIADLVLRDNYLQSQAISVTESRGAAVVEPIARFMRMLERAGQLNRAIEFLPDDETLTERQAANLGLTRPELSTVLAYAKMVLYEELLKGDLPDDPYLASDLAKYFPKPLRKRFQAGIERHQLRREIIATSVANSIVNRAGISYVRELQDELDVPASDIARAYAVTREVLDLRGLWTAIEALDNRVPAATQIEMQVMCEGLVRWATAWFVRNLPRPLDVAATIDRFHPGLRQLGVRLGDLLRDLEAEAFRNRIAHLVEREVPEDLARRVAALEPLAAALDIVQAAERAQADVDAVAEVYFSIGAKLGLDWLRVQAERMPAENHWERTAITEIVDDLYTQQRTLTHQVLTCASGAGPEAAVENWSAERANGVARALQLVSDLKASGGLDIPKLAIANRHVQQLIVG